ncbi:Ribosomal RNA large subunit methyltransferase L [Candidatus Nitrospira nitrosa]|uniref:Ribosomal RNA large subunit methyltransferase L n=1 Tax=Candidatus Nitrospira nitrosa TaxID=1742972 RepID=A0A0S4LTQ3_9BACT|nr:THUMP domain-containing protein [Candidatus Nitrospira nitrosa]CUS39380.1 Ribosomal RNA large subunit methyltransferase L [Candidatus Nitrospira nitrosa]
MDSTTQRFFAPCPRGLEGILEAELQSLGVPMTTKTEGGVGFNAPWSTTYWINLKSHIASRVLWEVGQRAYKTEQDVYHAAYALAWPDWFTPTQTIKVKVSARRCPLPSLDFLTLRIKDAICDKFVAAQHKRPSVDTQRPNIRVDAFLDQSTVTFYLDTSGEPLFKRGHRLGPVEAPLRENLAAGILRLTGWTPHDLLLDPMCGSGTIPLEAALMARQVAPGIARNFGFERLLTHDATQWERQREAARAKQVAAAPSAIYASDRDPAMVEIAQRTFQGAGIADDIRLKQSDILDLLAPAAQGVMVINPPYGVRLSRRDELESFYPKLGDWLKQRFAGWRAYVLTGDARVPKLIGLTPSKRIPLFNGALECRLYEFVIVQGGARRRLIPPKS